MKNRTVLITGCNGGIGHALMEGFSKNGYSVWAHARKKSIEFSEKINKLNAEQAAHIQPIYFELTNKLMMIEAIKHIKASGEIIDTLINNAGSAHGGMLLNTSMDSIREIFEVNYFAGLELVKLAFPMLAKSGSGNIINVVSTLGLDAAKGNCGYGASKSALIAATKILSLELAPWKVRVNAIAPGFTETKMKDALSEQAIIKEHLERSAQKRIAQPSEIADSVLFLASENAAHITGQILRIDGGFF